MPDHEAVPRQVEPEGAMTASVHREVVPCVGLPNMSVRASTNRGLASFFDAGLTFLGSGAGGWFGAFGSSATLPAGIGT